jgi:hypothetical protein
MRSWFRGFALLSLTLLSAASSSSGALVPGDGIGIPFIPRWSEYQYSSSSSMQTVQLFTTDSDEPLRTASAQVVPPATTLGSIAITSPGSTKFHGSANLRLNSGQMIPFSGSVITDNAPDLDAFAFGISDGTSLLAFFQMRMAGSSATVSDTSLAAQAVAAGLWTNVNAYFEFPSSHAGIGLVTPGVQPTGPASYHSFPIPEPASLTLLATLTAAAGMPRQRRSR